MKSIFQSKTFYVNLISGLVMFLEGQQVIDIIPAGWTPYVAAGVFALNIVLRYLTVQPVAPLMGPKPGGPGAYMLIVALLLAPLAACGKKPAVLIGQAGVISVDSIYEVHKAVIALNLPPAQERPIQAALLKANGALAPVPDLIIAIDNATKAGEVASTEIDKASAYLLEAAKYLDSISGNLQAVPTAVAALSLVGKIQAAVATLTRAVNQVRQPVPKAERVERTEAVAALRLLYSSPLAAN